MSTVALTLAQDTRPGAGLRRAVILATCTGVTFLYAMTVTIANVSLPQMQGSLSATQDQIAWVVTFNIVATAIVTPMSGWLVSRFGRRRLMLGCIVLFGFASLMCGLADSLASLVAFRVLQGAAGAPLVPVPQAIVQDTYPKHQLGAVIAVFGMGAVTGPIVGPVVGGYLSEAFSWRWVFFMILPFTGLALLATWVYIHDRARPRPVRLDWTGLLTLSVAVACVQLMLDRGERADWFDSIEIVGYAAFAIGGLYLFVAHTLTTDNPFLNPTLLKDRNYTLGLVIVFVFGMLNFTPMTLLPPLLQNISGYPDSVIGFILGARGSGTALAFLTMTWASRFDPRIPILIGFVLQGLAGLGLAQLDVNLSTGDIFWLVFVQGFGVGILWVPITVVTFSTLRPEHVPEGTAVFHLLRNMGSSIHISISIALVLRMTRTSYADMLPAISPFNEALRMPWVSGAHSIETVKGLAALSSELTRQATMIGYIDSFYFFALTSVVVLPLVAFIRWPR